MRNDYTTYTCFLCEDKDKAIKAATGEIDQLHSALRIANNRAADLAAQLADAELQLSMATGLIDIYRPDSESLRAGTGALA